MDASRAVFRAGGAAEADVEWAIQNARVVLQGLQMRANEVGRDHSMADNVKWILDHNPGAKIVLWAHNTHVAGGGLPQDMMGSTLRRAYGQQMVVFGLTFNRGSFHAVQAGGGTVRVVTVPVAPPGTLDAMLASAAVPMFALPLGTAPAWFSEQRQSRLIGATYPDRQPYAHLRRLVPAAAFDALIFIDQTTAARRNPGL
jgi:erythromycin esterase